MALRLLVVSKYVTTTNRNGITEHEPAVRSIDHAADFFVAEEVIAIEKKEKLKGIYFKISEKDQKLIEQKMELAGVRNMSAFLSKMAIDGYVISLELPKLAERVRQDETNRLLGEILAQLSRLK